MTVPMHIPYDHYCSTTTVGKKKKKKRRLNSNQIEIVRKMIIFLDLVLRMWSHLITRREVDISHLSSQSTPKMYCKIKP
ncbi:hypothetical protein BLOT_010046 [Blomia tropicalis]|nr:hypothetical protein BLOT_010046 [Blomia tropicalis]